jgi:hypothetical protein
MSQLTNVDIPSSSAWSATAAAAIDILNIPSSCLKRDHYRRHRHPVLLHRGRSLPPPSTPRSPASRATTAAADRPGPAANGKIGTVLLVWLATWCIWKAWMPWPASADTLNTILWMQGDKAATCFVHIGIQAMSMLFMCCGYWPIPRFVTSPFIASFRQNSTKMTCKDMKSLSQITIGPNCRNSVTSPG